LFDSLVRSEVPWSHELTAIDIQLLPGRQGFLGWDVDVWSDRTHPGFNPWGHSLTPINIQFDPGGQGFRGMREMMVCERVVRRCQMA
jgi:hypothetical protein